MSDPREDLPENPPPSPPGTADRWRPAAVDGRGVAGAPPEAGPLARWKVPLLAGAVLLAGVAVTLSIRLVVAEPPALELDVRGRVAVLPAVNATGDRGEEWVGFGLMELISDALAHTDGVSVIPPAEVRRTITSRHLDAADPGARERSRRLTFALGAELVLDLAVDRRSASPGAGDDGERYELAFHLHDAGGVAASGELEAADPVAAADRLATSLARGLAGGSAPAKIRRIYSGSPFLDRLFAMGLHELRSGDPETAQPYFEIAVAHQPRFLQARARLAECERRRGRLDDAWKHARGVLDDAQGRGERRVQVDARLLLGRIAALRGRHEAAREHYAQAHSILLGIGDRAAQTEVLGELARLALARGERGRAEELFVEILQIEQAIDDRLGQADTLIEIGTLFLAAGDLEGAEEMFAETRELARGLDDAWIGMRVAASLGEVASRRAEGLEGEEGRRTLEAAAELWGQALAFSKERRDRERELLLTRNLAEAMIRIDDYDRAEDLLLDLVELSRELDNPAFEAAGALRLAWILLRTGYPLQARTHVERAIELDRWIVDERLGLQLLIAWLAYEQGNYRLAVDTQRRAKRQAGEEWSGWHESFLRVFERGLATGRRWPVPGEGDYRAEEYRRDGAS